MLNERDWNAKEEKNGRKNNVDLVSFFKILVKEGKVDAIDLPEDPLEAKEIIKKHLNDIRAEATENKGV